MSTKLKISFGLYLLNALILLAFGFRYFFAGELMPYHAEILGIARDGLTDAYSIIFTTLYRATGAGMLAIAATTVVLLVVPFRNGQPWSRWALSGIGLLYAGLSLFLTLALQAETTANIPWPGPAAAVVTLAVAHVLAGELKAPSG